MKKLFGWLLMLVGGGLIIFSIVYFFFGTETIIHTGDPIEETGVTLGFLIKSGVAGIIGLISGATLVNRARAGERTRIIQEIRQLGEEKEAEWLKETDGNIPLPEWLKQKGYLDKYKSVVDLDS